MSALVDKARKRLRSSGVAWTATVLIVLGYQVRDYLVKREDVKGTRVAVINQGTAYVGTSVPELYAEDMQKMLAKQAANCVFSMGPEGYTQGETIRHLFNSYSKNKLADTWTSKVGESKSNAEIFKEQEIVQMFIPGQLARQVVDERTVKMAVDGVVTQTAKNAIGISTGPLVESRKMRALFWLIRNDDWTDNNKFPMVVGDFRIEALADKSR